MKNQSSLFKELLEAASEGTFTVYFSLIDTNTRSKYDVAREVEEAVAESGLNATLSSHGGGGGTVDLEFQVPSEAESKSLTKVIQRAAGRNLQHASYRSDAETELESRFEDRLYALTNELPPETKKAIENGSIRESLGFSDRLYADEQEYVKRAKLRTKTKVMAWSPNMVWRYVVLEKAGKI